MYCPAWSILSLGIHKSVKRKPWRRNQTESTQEAKQGNTEKAEQRSRNRKSGGKKELGRIEIILKTLKGNWGISWGQTRDYSLCPRFHNGAFALISRAQLRLTINGWACWCVCRRRRGRAASSPGSRRWTRLLFCCCLDTAHTEHMRVSNTLSWAVPTLPRGSSSTKLKVNSIPAFLRRNQEPHAHGGLWSCTSTHA